MQEDTVEGTLCMTTGMVTTQTGGNQDILAVITENIATTHQSNNITDIESPSTSTDSRMIEGSTGGLDRADIVRNSTEITRIRTILYQELSELSEVLLALSLSLRPIHYLFSAR